MTVRAGAAPPACAPAADAAQFLGQWLKTPASIGAVAPSSVHLARAAAAPLPECGEPTVVELGPGTGPFTEEIQRRLGGRGRQVAIESNAVLADALGRRYPRVDVVHGDAVHLRRFLGERAIVRADVIVSGLPWSLIAAEKQTKLLDAVVSAMGPQSVFTTFAYRHAIPLTAARRFRASLTQRFEEVIPSRTVWRNLPPAFVFHARRPRA